MRFSRRQGAYANTSGMVFGSSFMDPPPPFSPGDLSGLVADVDIQDSASFVTSGSLFTSVTNKWSGVVWTIATNRPTYIASGTNGKPWIGFNGTTQRIIHNEPAVLAALSGAHTIFCVAEFDVLNRDEAVIATGNSASSLGIRSWGQNTTGVGRWARTTLTDAGGVVTSISTAKSQPGAHVHCWRGGAAGTVTNQLNKGVQDPANDNHNPGATNSDRFAIGCRPRSSPTLHFQGKVGQWLVYDRELSDEEVAQVIDYLYDRWAITPLQHVITQGDSITAGNTAGAVSIASLLTAPGAIIADVATGGRKATEVLATDIDAEMVQFRSTGDVISWLLIGSNDLATGDGTPGNYATSAQVLSTVAAIVAELRARQITTVVGTILYRQGSGWGNNPAYNTAVDAVNAAILATGNGGIYGDYVVDTNAAMVAAGGFALYLDATHPNPTGTAALAVVAQEGIDLALA
jgi:lysophospholipase L1-like esterase